MFNAYLTALLFSNSRKPTLIFWRLPSFTFSEKKTLRNFKDWRLSIYSNELTRTCSLVLIYNIFNDCTLFNHLKTKLVRYADVYSYQVSCVMVIAVNWDNEMAKNLDLLFLIVKKITPGMIGIQFKTIFKSYLTIVMA